MPFLFVSNSSYVPVTEKSNTSFIKSVFDVFEFGFANNLRLEENKDLPINSNLGDKVSDFVGFFEYKYNDNLEFELAAVFDLAGIRAPKRQCTRTEFPSIGTFIA